VKIASDGVGSFGVGRGRLAAGAVAAAGVLAAVPAGGIAGTCPNKKLGASASGHSVVLSVCERITIRLTQAFDGGYQWSQSQAPKRAVLKLISHRSVSTEPKGTVGGYNAAVFVYEAVRAGTTSLTLVEDRSFQKHSQIGRFKLTTHVS
jgi:predicted secreted protein